MTIPPPPAGWYPDPAGTGGQRWWGGVAWTDHVTVPGESQATAASAAAAPPATRVARPQSVIPVAADPMVSSDLRVRSNRIDVVQRFKLSTNVYEVSIDGRVVAWARQKIMALKERIEIWEDDTQTELVCAVQARAVMDLRSAYDVLDGAGMRIAVLRKVFGKSLLRSTWQVESVAGEQLATVTEASMVIAIVRRIKGFVDLIPVIGWALAFIPVPYGFTWLDPTTGATLGEYRRTIGVRDRYVLSLGGDPDLRIDRRAAVALAICLDALQSR